MRALARRAGAWCAALSDASRLESRAVVLATGRHELRGHARPACSMPPLVGFKMHWQPRPQQAAALGDAVELFPYDGGYADPDFQGVLLHVDPLTSSWTIRAC